LLQTHSIADQNQQSHSRKSLTSPPAIQEVEVEAALIEKRKHLSATTRFRLDCLMVVSVDSSPNGSSSNFPACFVAVQFAGVEAESETWEAYGVPF